MQSQCNTIKIAIVGLANVGKTTFLNTLTGSNLKTANFSGSTTGINEIAFKHKEKTFVFFDLPGINSFEKEENELAKNTISFLKKGNFNAVLHIINSEFSYFSGILQKELKKNISKPILTAINFPSEKFTPEEIMKNFEKPICFSAISKENNEQILNLLLNLIEKKDVKAVNMISKKRKFNSSKATKIIDKIALSKIFGIPMFFGIMMIIFWLSFEFGKVIGDFLVSGFDLAIEAIEGAAFLSDFVKAFSKSVLVGVGTVVGFIPTIVICVSLISLLEQTGYVTRVCFLLDKFFEKFNLGGKSLIPLIVGAGCSITAYMSAKMINDPKEKFLTMVIIGFVPCTAKLAVFMLFCIALFGDAAPIAISIIYLAGFLIGLLAAKLLGFFVKGGIHEKTKIEIFDYRIPNFKGVLKSGYTRTLDYIKNAATFIASFAALLSLFSLIGFEGGSFVILSEDQMPESIVGMIGKFLVPLFAPMDFDYRMIISLITGLIAKETAISTLAILYASSEDGLAEVIKGQISLRHAVSYLVFMFFYLPCVSATMSFYRESGSLKKTIFLIGFTMSLAYFFAFVSNFIFLFF